jgi:hypothetical protein
LEIFRTILADKLQTRRKTLRGLPYIDAMPGSEEIPAFGIDSLAQLKLVADPYPGAFAQGHTMRSTSPVHFISLIVLAIWEVALSIVLRKFIKKIVRNRIRFGLDGICYENRFLKVTNA